MQARVTASGIEYGGEVYGDPSTAAVAAKKDCGGSETAASTNGLKFWMMIHHPNEKGYGVADFIDWLRKQPKT